MFSFLEEQGQKFIRIYDTIVAVDDISYIRSNGNNSVVLYLKSGGSVTFDSDEPDSLITEIFSVLNNERQE